MQTLNFCVTLPPKINWLRVVESSIKKLHDCLSCHFWCVVNNPMVP